MFSSPKDGPKDLLTRNTVNFAIYIYKKKKTNAYLQLEFAGSLSGEMALLRFNFAYRGSSSLALGASCQTLVCSSWGRVVTEMQGDARFVTCAIPSGAVIT